ncbi:putative molybdenum carrier protein [Polycyclovorans algicola]|uniref:putative molybdenum carrier protein n=1 Tax=Polycyclovorans algicola TaxID=616992 RepID=UPI000A04F0E4|nr:putative molybdenum carrier protein [Polycyclovorans algicola]
MNDDNRTGPTNTEVPILTVMAEYGNAPFLWISRDGGRDGVGPNICDGSSWDPSFPMSEGLWRKFADWAIDFDRTSFFTAEFDDADWDWRVFHARGLQLSQWLKEEVGSAYRVIYEKPVEDPNHRVDERTEIERIGNFKPLAVHRNADKEPVRFCEKIISGGQTGADRAALDFAILHRYVHGGWAPRGRAAEDGAIALKYQLTEVTDGGYRQRTRRNVADSDGTLIVNIGELSDGTYATKVFAQKLGKPCLVLQADDGVHAHNALAVVAWLRRHGIQILNVAGPRESKRPGIYRLTRQLLEVMQESLVSE